MSEVSPTLRSLISLGFKLGEASYSMATAIFRFRRLDLEAVDAMTCHGPVVSLYGVSNTGRAIGEVGGEVPQDLDTPSAAAAWVSYALRSHKKVLEPLPDWMVEGERNWDLIPQVRKMRAFQARSRCRVDRDHALVFRNQLRDVICAGL